MRAIQIKRTIRQMAKLICKDNKKTIYQVQDWTGLKQTKEMISKTHNLKKGSIKWENRWTKTVGYLKMKLVWIIGLKEFPNKIYKPD